jgi:hypothetical protein
MEAGLNQGRLMELKVLDYAEEHALCRLGEIADEISRRIGIPVSAVWVQQVLEAGDFRVVNMGGELMVDHASEDEGVS